MKILSWNIACLPNNINFFSNPNNRISSILKRINEIDADIICLQEVFDKNIRKMIINFFKNKYYYYFSEDPLIYLNDGLLTLTRTEIIKKKNFFFNYSSGEDSFASKGFHYVVIKDIKSNKILSVINTHLNANPILNIFTNPINVRIKQFENIYTEINKNKYNCNILCGDINCNFNDKEKNMFLSNLSKNYKYIYLNNKKIKTFKNKQLDYIIYYGNMDIKKYNLNLDKNQTESDHNVIISEIII